MSMKWAYTCTEEDMSVSASYVPSPKPLDRFAWSMVLWGEQGSLHQKLSAELDLCSYLSNINPNLHETEMEHCNIID